MSDIRTVGEAFAPLIGQIVWGCKRTHGTVLAMEFGPPSLSIRDPIRAVHATSDAIRRRLARRRVSLVGQWHLLIDHGDWEIHTEAGTIASADFDDASLQLFLEELDGQYLTAASPGSKSASCVLSFDLGGYVCLLPTEAVGADQWLLYGPDEKVIVRRNDGRLFTGDDTR
jgi:hypothetical protein